MHDRVLKTITRIAGTGFLVFAASLDSTGIFGRVALIGTITCTLWITLFAIAQDI